MLLSSNNTFRLSTVSQHTWKHTDTNTHIKAKYFPIWPSKTQPQTISQKTEYDFYNNNKSKLKSKKEFYFSSDAISCEYKKSNIYIKDAWIQITPSYVHSFESRSTCDWNGLKISKHLKSSR